MPRSLPSKSSRTPLDRAPRRAPLRSGRAKPVLRRAHEEETHAHHEHHIPIEVTKTASGHPHPIHRIWPNERLVSPAEKRELILAHAVARAAKGVGGVWTYYIGIAASFLIVGTGWWFTVGSNLRQRLLLPSTEPGIVEQIQEQSSDLERRYPIPDPRALNQILTPPTPASSTTSTANPTAPSTR